MESNTHHKRRRIGIILMILFVTVLIIVGLRAYSSHNADQNLPAAADTPSEKVSITNLLDAAKAIKKDLSSALKDIKNNKLSSARIKLSAILDNIASIRASIERTRPLLVIPYLQSQLDTVLEILDVANMGVTDILLPATDLLEAHPISDLRVGDGINASLLGHYLDFAESVMPQADTIMQLANSIDISLLDNDGKISGYLQIANQLMDFYHSEPTIFSTLKAMLGAEEDRLYLLVAQNSSEIRASGGYPGSIGTVRIQDGILTLEDFKTANQALSAATPRGIQITSEEIALFNFLSGMQVPRDADLCPDFVRVGHIWAAAYEAKNHEAVSGVITMTPHIVQRLLHAMDAEIQLFDGLVLNGTTATQVLQHDIYFKYFGRNYASGNASIADQLFSDAAHQTMKKLMENMSLTQVMKYFPILTESVGNRTLMLWMKDEGEQQFITKMGCDGGLNTDPEAPEAGIFFNCTTPSKMGWFLLMDTQIGERTKNEDGSFAYPVTVTFSNNITDEEIESASHYITASLGGTIQGATYFFAPAGGTVSNFVVSNGVTVKNKTYNGLELGFISQLLIKPNTPITVTYTVTTAPGVETPLAIMKTPTAQQ